MTRKPFLPATVLFTALVLMLSVANAQESGPMPAPKASPTAAPTTGPGSTPRPRVEAITIGAGTEQVSALTPDVNKSEAKRVLVWIKNGTIVAFGLAEDYKDKNMLTDAYETTARTSGNKLVLEFLAPLNGQRAANPLKLAEGTFVAFDGSCGIANGTYRVNNAGSNNPSVEISIVQMSAHRRRRSRRRDECDPFGGLRRASVFRSIF